METLETSPEQQNLCSACQGINIDSIRVDGGYRHRFLHEIEDSRETCTVCDTIMLAFEWGRRRKTPETEYGSSHFLNISLCPERITGTQLLLRVFTEAGFVDAHSKLLVQAYLMLYTDEGDRFTQHGALALIRSVPSYTGSEHSMALARKWIADCVMLEGCCEASVTHPDMDLDTNIDTPRVSMDVRPRRLVEINHRGTDYLLRLVDGLASSHPYATLSYCWGPGPWNWRTVRSNIVLRQNRFDATDLPQTLKDACVATISLGLSHIWIDCLCIVQDDREEWAKEAPRMGRIYHGSTVTIAAARAASSHEGLFNVESRSRWPANNKLEANFCSPREDFYTVTSNIGKISTRFADGTQSVIRCMEPYAHSSLAFGLWQECLVDSPLMKRGWVYQERMSSRRTIFFTSEQMLWQCVHHTGSEDNVLPTKTGMSHDEHTLEKVRRCLQEMYTARLSRHSSSTLGHAFDFRQFLQLWYDTLVISYSQSGLTCPGDKLVAISGLASLVYENTLVRYFAGHWLWSDATFIRSLLWVPMFTLGHTPTPRQTHAPSWSWASQDAGVSSWLSDWLVYEEPRELCCSFDVTDAASSADSCPPGEKLVLTGPLTQCRVEVTYHELDDRRQEPMISGRGRQNYFDDTAKSGLESGSMAFLSLFKNPGLVLYLILQPISTGSLVMKRVGFGRSSTEDDRMAGIDAKGWHEELHRGSVATVTMI